MTLHIWKWTNTLYTKKKVGYS